MVTTGNFLNAKLGPSAMNSSDAPPTQQIWSTEAEVMRMGKPLLEVDPAHSDRLNVHLPLRDSSGQRIGIVTLVHPYRDGDDKSKLLESSTRIRDALSSQVSSVAALLALDP